MSTPSTIVPPTSSSSSTHPLVQQPTRGELADPTSHTKLHPVNLAKGPDTESAGTTAQTNPTIVPPPAHNHPTGPHPPTDATHLNEKVVNLPNPAGVSNLSVSNRVKRLENNRTVLGDLTRMLSHSYSNTDSFIILPTTEEDDPHATHHQQHATQTSGDDKLAKDLKKDQEQIDKLNSRRDYVYRKIARAILKRDGAWGLYDETHGNLLAAALLIPPARDPSQNSQQLRLEDPHVNEGHASHYVTLADLFKKKNPRQLVTLGPSLIKRIRLELRLFDTAMTVHQRPDAAFLYFFGDLDTAHNNRASSGAAEQSLTQHHDPAAKLDNLTHLKNHDSNLLLEELGRRYPMIVTAERYRDNKRFLMLLQNGFQEIDKVQGFRERYAEGEAHVVAPGIGSKQIAHGKEGPDHVYESCFLSLVKGVYPSLKNEEHDVRGVVPQKQAEGVISDPNTVIPPAHLPTH